MKKYENPEIIISIFNSETVGTANASAIASYNEWIEKNQSAARAEYKLSELKKIIRISF